MLQVKVHGTTGTILLDRAARGNALSRDLIEKLIEAFGDLHQEKQVRAVILSASGSTFCSGVDLLEWKETAESREPMPQWHTDSEQLQQLYEDMLRFPKPIIAAVDGHALGAGFGLVLACDLVVASHRARFGLPAPRLGLVSGLVAPLLVFRSNGSTAARMLLGDEELDSVEAHRVGLAHHLVDPSLVWARAKQWSDQLALTASESLQLTKRLLNEMVGENLLTWLASGAAVTATACTTEAAIEGLKAFAEKRPPKFR